MMGWRVWVVAAGLAGTAIACRPPRAVVYDLLRMQDESVLVSDTRRIDFGTPAGRKHIRAGWSNDEQDPTGRTFAWAIAPAAMVTFDITELADTLAEISCRPFLRKDSQQTMQVALNGHPLLTKPMGLAADFRSYQILLPAKNLRLGSNLLALDFAYAGELPGKGPKPAETRTLAACFDTIQFSRFGQESSGAPSSPGSDVAPAALSTKDALGQPSGSVRWFVLKVPDAIHRPRLEFTCAVSAEHRDTASTMSLDVETDGAGRQGAFSEVVQAGARRSARVDLDPWSGQICRFLFRVEGTAPAGLWVQPRITAEETKAAGSREDERVEAARQQLSKTNLVIILLDAAAYSHFSVHGYPLNTTPNIDRIAREGLDFTSAYCNAVYTEASTGSLMTGTYPDIHKVLFPKDRLPTSAYTMAEMLSSRNLKTAAFIGNSQAGALRGYDQGFQTIHELFRYPEFDRKCANQNIWLFPWLDANRNNPFFLYLHFREPHFGGPPPQEFLDKFSTGYKGHINALDDREKVNQGTMPMTDADLKYIISVYDATLNFADYEVGLIEKKLQELGIWDRTMVVILADHGEALWEHNYFGHNVQVYQNMAHIPFFVHPPAGGAIPGGRRIDSIIETVDIFTTMAEVFHSEPGKANAQGRSLLGLLAVPGSVRPGFAVTRTLWQKPTYSIRDGRWEYSYSFRFGERELYDLPADPGDRNNVIDGHPVLADWFHQNLQQWINQQRTRAERSGSPDAASMDDATRRDLQDLGYLGANGQPVVQHDSPR